MKEKSQNHTEVIPNRSAEKSKKDMNQSGVFMTVAFVIMVFVWLVRKFVVKSQ